MAAASHALGPAELQRIGRLTAEQARALAADLLAETRALRAETTTLRAENQALRHPGDLATIGAGPSRDVTP